MANRGFQDVLIKMLILVVLVTGGAGRSQRILHWSRGNTMTNSFLPNSNGFVWPFYIFFDKNSLCYVNRMSIDDVYFELYCLRPKGYWKLFLAIKIERNNASIRHVLCFVHSCFPTFSIFLEMVKFGKYTHAPPKTDRRLPPDRLVTRFHPREPQPKSKNLPRTRRSLFWVGGELQKRMVESDHAKIM